MNYNYIVGSRKLQIFSEKGKTKVADVGALVGGWMVLYLH